MTLEELKKAWTFGANVVEAYKENGEPVPTFATERLLILGNEMLKKLEEEMKAKNEE